MPDFRERLESLRPSAPCDLSAFVRYGNIGTGVLFLAAGIYSIVTFFTNSDRDALRFVSFIYICFMGVLLALAELNFPPCTLQYFAFLSGKTSRAFFQLFPAVLCLSIGFEGGSGSANKIFLIIVGFAALIFGFLGFCYGSDYGVVTGGTDVEVGRGTTANSGGVGSVFGRRKNQATVGPDVAI